MRKESAVFQWMFTKTKTFLLDLAFIPSSAYIWFLKYFLLRTIQVSKRHWQKGTELHPRNKIESKELSGQGYWNRLKLKLILPKDLPGIYSFLYWVAVVWTLGDFARNQTNEIPHLQDSYTQKWKQQAWWECRNWTLTLLAWQKRVENMVFKSALNTELS